MGINQILLPGYVPRRRAGAGLPRLAQPRGAASRHALGSRLRGAHGARGRLRLRPRSCQRRLKIRPKGGAKDCHLCQSAFNIDPRSACNIDPPGFVTMNTPRHWTDEVGGGGDAGCGDDCADPSGSSGEGRSDQEARPGFEGFQEHDTQGGSGRCDLAQLRAQDSADAEAWAVGGRARAPVGGQREEGSQGSPDPAADP